MGACSSKPKTAEFEGSMEPRKPTGAAADQPQATGRSLENPADDHGKEAFAKVAEGGEAAHATTETLQTTPESDVRKHGAQSKEVLSSSAEGSSKAESNVLGGKESGQKEANDEAEQKESKVVGVTGEVVPKSDDAVGVSSKNNSRADIKESSVADEAKTVADIKESKAVDDTKTCEDKAVVSEEAGSGEGDAVYVDKTVPLDENKAAETPAKRNIIVPEEEVSTMIDSAGMESPITGVVQPVEHMKEVTNNEDVSNKVFTEADVVTAKETTENPSTGAGDVDAGAVATEDAQKDLLAPPREAPTEGIDAVGVEILEPTSAVESLPQISAVETLAPVEADPQNDVEEGTSQRQGEVPSDAVVDVSSATVDPKDNAKETSTYTKVGVPADESDPKMEDAQEDLKTDDVQVEGVNEKAIEETGVRNGPSQALATEEANEDAGPTITSGEKHESKPESKEKDEKLQEFSVEAGKETPDKLLVEHMNSGDVQFEDASDAPLKSEASKPVESGQIPR